MKKDYWAFLWLVVFVLATASCSSEADEVDDAGFERLVQGEASAVFQLKAYNVYLADDNNNWKLYKCEYDADHPDVDADNLIGGRPKYLREFALYNGKVVVPIYLGASSSGHGNDVYAGRTGFSDANKFDYCWRKLKAEGKITWNIYFGDNPTLQNPFFLPRGCNEMFTGFKFTSSALKVESEFTNLMGNRLKDEYVYRKTANSFGLPDDAVYFESAQALYNYILDLVERNYGPVITAPVESVAGMPKDPIDISIADLRAAAARANYPYQWIASIYT